MRLDSLYINGYGTLNNFELSFEEDLTVVYGLNGAGKSTLLSFFRACLYGFYPRGSGRRYEPLQGGTHGGILNVKHKDTYYLIERTAHRLSGGIIKIDNLTTGKTEPKSKIETLLSGVSQSVFESVFAFGLRELQQLELLKNQELASHLYSVGLGSKISLAKIDQQLTTAMEQIYKPRGRKPELNAVLEEATDLRRNFTSTKEQTQQYRELVNKITEVQEQITTHRESIDSLNNALQRTKIFLEAWPHWQKLVMKEAELQKYPVLDLPYNGLERATNASKELEKSEVEYENVILNIPQPQRELVETIDAQVLQNEFEEYKKLITTNQIATEVAEERLHKAELEANYLKNKLDVIETDIEKAYVGVPDTELTVRQQWLARLKEVYSQQQNLKAPKASLVSLIGTWGWLLVTVLFLFTDQKVATVLTSVAFLGSIIHHFIKKRDFNQEKQVLTREIRELADKLGLTNLGSEIQLAAQALEEEASLVQERKLLLRELELKQTENKNLRLEAETKQVELANSVQEWQNILAKNGLPSDWSDKQVEEFLKVAQILPSLSKEIEKHKNELEIVLQACDADDLLEVQRVYEEQEVREKLQQETVNLEAVLSTYLNESLHSYRERLKNSSKEVLVQENNALELELKLLKTELEENLNLLGSLNAKKELLEKDKEQDQLKLELEFINNKIHQLTTSWASFKTCQWVINQVKNRYEKEKQPELLLYATDYFNKITGGEYTRVFAPLGTQELKVEEATGKILDVTQLSQGTVEQLYLSLRFALIACMNNQGVELPVLVDDILVNFDHIRLEQTINLINEISKNQQIIILTCHKSLANFFDKRQRRTITPE